METIRNWIDQIQQAGIPLVEGFISYLPHLAGAMALLVLGWFVSGLVRTGMVKLVRAVVLLANRVLARGGNFRLKLSPPVLNLLSKLLFWVVFLFFVNLAAHNLMLTAVSDWLDQVVNYLPTFVAGGVILVGGALLSILARDVTYTAASSADLPQARLMGTLAQAGTLVTTLIIGLDQIGIDVTFLANLVVIMVAALLGSLALAFGLGARLFISNVIGAHFLRQQYQPGQRLRLGEHEGTILEFTSTAVILATEEGRQILPAHLYSELPSTLVLPREDKEEKEDANE